MERLSAQILSRNHATDFLNKPHAHSLRELRPRTQPRVRQLLQEGIPSTDPHLITPIVLRQVQPFVRRRDQLAAVAAGFRSNGRQADTDRQA